MANLPNYECDGYYKESVGGMHTITHKCANQFNTYQGKNSRLTDINGQEFLLCIQCTERILGSPFDKGGQVR